MLIQIKNLKKSYQLGETCLTVLKGLSLSIAAGQYIAIMGASGSGKSTLMHILGCLDSEFNGAFYLDSEEIHRLSSRRLAEVRRNKVGFIFQTFNLIAKLTATENVSLPLVYNRIKSRSNQAENLLKQVGLQNRMHHLPSQLSGGERQRVAIARALVNNPAIILADEPTGNLDSKSGAQIMTVIDQLNQNGKTVIIVTHDRQIAEHARTIIHMQDGMIIDTETL